jgi:hypothetical protein
MSQSPLEIEHLIVSAEARIETAMAQLLLASKGVTAASDAQVFAIAELRAARAAIKAIRTHVATEPDSPRGA